MKTLLMRAWRRFGATGWRWQRPWPRPGRCANMSDKASRAGGGQRARCRTTGRGRGPGGGHAAGRIAPAATAGSRGLGAPCQPGSAGGASIAGRGAVSGYRCGRDHPAGTSAGPTRRAGVDGACGIASRNARLECDRRRSRAVGWPAARGRQRRRLRILCPRRQAQRRSGAVGGPGPVRRRAGRRWRAGHGERHAGGPPEDALRFVAARQGGILTAMLRHRDDAVAVGDEDQADPAALQACPPNPLRRAALSSSTETGWTAGRRAVRATDTASGQTGCDMALNRYRLAAMLGLCGCLAGVQAQTILVELEVGKAGCCPTRACGAWRSATGRYCARPTPTGRKSSFSAAPRASPRCMSGRTLDGPPPMRSESCQQARRANVPRSRRCSRAFRRPGACTSAAASSSKATICPTRTAPASPRWPSAIRQCWTSRDRSAGTAWCCWTCRSWRSRPRACVRSA